MQEPKRKRFRLDTRKQSQTQTRVDDLPEEMVERILLHAANDIGSDCYLCAAIPCLFVCNRWRSILHPLAGKKQNESVVEWAA
jgi:hypothetical protein